MQYPRLSGRLVLDGKVVDGKGRSRAYAAHGFRVIERLNLTLTLSMNLNLSAHGFRVIECLRPRGSGISAGCTCSNAVSNFAQVHTAGAAVPTAGNAPADALADAAVAGVTTAWVRAVVAAKERSSRHWRTECVAMQCVGHN